MSPHLKAGLGSLSIRLLVPLLLTVTAVLAVSAFIALRTTQSQVEAIVRTDTERTSSLIERATHDGMLLNRKDQVQQTLERLSEGPAVAVLRVYDMEGELTMSGEPAEIGRRVPLSAAPCVPCHRPGEPLVSRDAASGDRDIPETHVARDTSSRLPGLAVMRHLRVIPNEPECAAAGCHVSPAEQSKLGVLEVEVSLQPVEHTLDRARRQTGWTLLALVLVTSLVSAGFVHRVVLRPVDRLHAGTERIARGDLDVRIDTGGEHELARLAEAFNAMAEDLSTARAELAGWSQKMEQQVLRKTRELQRTQRQVVQMEKMASLGKLSATVAHELNNPISSMLTYARLIERELAGREEHQGQVDLDGAVRDELLGYLRFLAEECGRCGKIVQNLLLFARRTGGATERAPVDLTEILERSLMLVRHHLEMAGVTLRREVEMDDPRVVMDPGQIEQALVALMVNAVEAMSGEGAPRHGALTVALREAGGGEAEGGDVIEIEITDTGVGMTPEVQARVFEPFFSTKREESGVGLGLAVVYGIVQRHGGRIDVDSEPGRGTTFRLRLPRRPRQGGDTVVDDDTTLDDDTTVDRETED